MAADARPRVYLAAALLCMLLGLLLQFTIVHIRYGGNWTGLFFTGSYWKTPPALPGEQIYVHPRSTGYDGQMYHYAAHDPLMQTGIGSYMDNPRVRYQRILLPAIAFLLAGGRQAFIDEAYISANLLFLFLGAWWLGRYLDSLGLQPGYAALFLLSPAALISLDRLTLDLAFTSLCLGFALYLRTGHDVKAAGVLMLACLCRDTGLVLAGASCLVFVTQRRFRKAAAWALCVVPALAWYGYVNARTVDISGDVLRQLIPLKGVLGTLGAPMSYPFNPIVSSVLASLDRLSILAILLAVLLSILQMRRRCFGVLEAAMLAWGLLALCLPRSFYLDPFSGPRVFTPLLMYAVLRGFPDIRWTAFAPMLMMLPRVGLEIAAPLLFALLGRQ